MEKRIFSGIQPSGNLHIGNYLGAMKNWVDLQQEAKCIYCVVNYHAITVPQDPKTLDNIAKEVVAWYVAAGIDPERSIIFRQSDVAEHTELAWILGCQTPIGELERMTQYKEKSGKDRERSSAGLFTYPLLMAADILLYDTTHVPVGDDQRQHIELTRDIAKRWNNRFGKTFLVPEADIREVGARIMGLDDPTKKMSKSAASEYNYVALSDNEEVIRRKIKKAVTDSGNNVRFGEDKPAVSNLLVIYQLFAGKTQEEVVGEMSGASYAELKEKVADAVVAAMVPMQERYREIMNTAGRAEEIMASGAERARSIAAKKMVLVRDRLGVRRGA